MYKNCGEKRFWVCLVLFISFSITILSEFIVHYQDQQWTWDESDDWKGEDDMDDNKAVNENQMIGKMKGELLMHNAFCRC